MLSERSVYGDGPDSGVGRRGREGHPQAGQVGV